ncbi:MAG TPA: hypothetical protein VMT44_01370 [Methanoregula sp.]|nr:hypothetical protein [Methanoregula sp.]
MVMKGVVTGVTVIFPACAAGTDIAAVKMAADSKRNSLSGFMIPSREWKYNLYYQSFPKK